MRVTGKEAAAESPAVEALPLKAAHTLRQKCHCSSRARLLLAVSGGADSVALFRLVLAGPDQYRIGVAHFDHALRPESEDDAEFVAALAAAHDVPFHSCRWSSPEPSEAAARAARFDFLTETARRHGYDAIVCGHHRDDQIETSLLRLDRGTGLRGLLGMSFHRRHANIEIVRPLLECSRHELRDYLGHIGQTWREDSSNQTNHRKRNQLRNLVLPRLDAALGPQWRRHWLDNLERLRQLWEESSRRARGIVEQARIAAPGDSWHLDRRTLRNCSRSELHTVLLHWWSHRGALDFNRRHVHQAARIIQSVHSGKTLELPNAFRLYIDQASVSLSPAASAAPKGRYRLLVGAPSRPAPVRPNGRIVHLPQRARAQVRAQAISPRLGCRTLRPGDKLQLPGAPGHRKLSRLFQDRRIPARLRAQWPVVVDAAGILWVPGVGIASRAASRGKGETMCELRLQSS